MVTVIASIRATKAPSTHTSFPSKTFQQSYNKGLLRFPKIRGQAIFFLMHFLIKLFVVVLDDIKVYIKVWQCFLSASTHTFPHQKLFNKAWNHLIMVTMQISKEKLGVPLNKSPHFPGEVCRVREHIYAREGWFWTKIYQGNQKPVTATWSIKENW